MKTQCVYGLLSLLLAGGIACDTPTHFEHTNPNDPGGADFTPAAPSNIHIRAENRRVILTWKDNSSHEEGYLIERALDDTTNFIELKKLPANSTSFADTINFAGFTPAYRVSAFSMNGTDMNKWDVKHISLNVFSPYLVQTENINEQLVRVTWKDTMDFETGFELERQSEDLSFIKVATLPANTVEFWDHITQTEDGGYIYRVRAVKNLHYSPYAQSLLNRFYILPPDSLIAQSLSATSIALFWRQRDNLAKTFIIERRRDQDYVEIGRVDASIKKFQDANLDSTRTYQYRLRTLISRVSTTLSLAYKKNFYPSQAFAHTAQVNAVAFSPDGALLATCGSDQVAKIWEVRTGQLLRVIQGPASPMNAVEFSPDGQMLATGSGEYSGSNPNGAMLWEVNSGQLIRTLASKSIYLIKFSPDGQYLALGAYDSFVSLRQVSTGLELVKRYQDSNYGNGPAVYPNFTFSPDGNMIVIGHADGLARLFDVQTAKLIRRFPNPPEPDYNRHPFFSVAFHPNGKTLAIATYFGVRVFQTDTAMEEAGFPGAAAFIAFSHNGNKLAVVGSHVMIWHVATRKLLNSISGGELRSAIFSPDGQFVATAGISKMAKIWQERWRWVAN